MLKVIVRTEEEETQHELRIAKRAIEIYEAERKANIIDSERTLLVELVAERFPHYNTKYYLNKMKLSIKMGEFGSIDRFNNPIASYNEVKKFLHK